MKKNAMLACSVIAIIVAYVSFEKQTNANEPNSWLALNIEALSSDEVSDEIEGISDCPGLALYSDVGKIEGRAILRYHINDSIDQMVTQTYKRCYAKGIGKTRGNDMFIWDVNTESIKEGKCLGELYHKASLYDE